MTIRKVDMSQKAWDENRERARAAVLEDPGSFCLADNRWLGEDVVEAVNAWVEARGGQAYLEKLEKEAEMTRQKSLRRLMIEYGRVIR